MSKRKSEEEADGDARASPGPGTRQEKFTLHLRALNRQFAKWISEQSAKHEGELWRDGVKDYLKHADKLVADFQDVLSSSQTPPTAAIPPASFSPPAFGSKGAPSLFGQPPPALSSPPAAAVSKPPFFPSATSSAPTFCAPPSAPATGLIGFPPASAAAPSSQPSSNQEADEGGDGDEDEPKRESSPSLQEDDSVEKQYEVLWSSKGKLFTQPAGETSWSDNGIGVFSIRRMKAGGVDGKPPAPYLVFMSNSGRALVTASLYKGLTPQRGKNKKMVIMKLVLGEGTDKMVLLKFGKDETAEECVEKVKDLSPK